MKHQNITVLSISDVTGSYAPSAGHNGGLGRLALESELQQISGSLHTQIVSVSAVATHVSFTSLTDTPSAYAQHSGNLVQVNNGETGLQFINFAVGSIDCDTINRVYVVNDPKIKSTSKPILTLVNPQADSASFIPTVYNVIDGQFSIILTGTPEIAGYKVNWLIF